MTKKQPKTAAPSGAQFLSERGFAARAADGSGRPNVIDIIAELIRLLGSTYLRHFNNDNGRSPAKPEFVEGFGIDQKDLMKWAREFTEECERVMVPCPHRLKMIKRKCDIPVLLSVVASYPFKAMEQPSDLELTKMTLPARRAVHRDLVAANRQLALTPEFGRWREATVAWALRRYAAAVPVTACVHVDESNLHIHMTFHNRMESVKPFMAGPRAALAAEKNGATKKEAQAALYAGFAALGDDYQRSVSSRFGHLRRSSDPKPSPTGKAYSKKRAKELAVRLVAQAEEESRVLREAATREAEAIRATAEERAKRDVEAAWELVEADIAGRRESELARLTSEAWAEVKPEYEQIKAAMLEASERFRIKESKWLILLEEAVPDHQERARLLRQLGP